MYTRLSKLSKKNSFFLFGARGTGKSTLLKQFAKDIKEYLWIDLLNPKTDQELQTHPEKLIEQVEALSKKPEWIIIDEIQKNSKLLDIVHKLIFEYDIKFALTGSSARKLKRGKANLLAGRAFSFKLYSMSILELENDFKLFEALQWGLLPGILKFSDDIDKKRYLYAYTQTYIKEEILIEQLVRKIDPFRAFLEVAAQSNTEILNYENIARDAKIDSKSVARYFEILSDTLIGFFLDPYSHSARKRQAQKPKFYFFDTGVQRALSNTLENTLAKKTYAFGKLFEQFIINEFIKLNEYYEKHYKFSYLRTKDGAEIDLIIETGSKIILIEIKSSDNITDKHLKTMKTLGAEISKYKYILSLEEKASVRNGIKIMPWRQGIEEIFDIF